jgi:hypothetical protein
VNRDPVSDARDVVAELFPQAVWALLAGSVTTAQRTAGSDLDIVVLLPEGDPQAPHRDSRHFRGWPVELFVHDEVSLAHYLAKDLPGRRPVMHRMVASGVPLAGDPGQWRDRCARTLAAGPDPLSDAELASRRYLLTDLLDDLTHAADRGERAVIATIAWITIAEQALAMAAHWTGSGKWLLRELRDLDAELADRWLEARDDPDAIAALIRLVLGNHGGPLFDGYRVAGERQTVAGGTVAAS